MKPACEPASRRPKPYESLKKPHESCPFAVPCGPRKKKNNRAWSDISFTLENLPVHAFDSRIVVPYGFDMSAGGYRLQHYVTTLFQATVLRYNIILIRFIYSVYLSRVKKREKYQ